MNPAIVVVAFNRPKSLKRLLDSINSAYFSNYENITLVISIDFQDSKANQECFYLANSFVWDYGEKKIVKHQENLGLRKHIISCGDMSYEYDAVIILEDDLIVSNQFYNYAFQANEFYQLDENVAGISLYSYEYEELGWFRFYPLNNGNDTHFIQWASSWGQLWTKAHWQGFKEWYDINCNNSLEVINIPDSVRNWRKSWKKYYISYLVDSNKYFVYPNTSLTTVKDEGGIHYKSDSRTNNVSIIGSNKKDKIVYRFTQFDLSESKYDVFFQPLPRKILIDNKLEYVDFDINGTKRIKNFKNNYILTIKNSKKVINSYAKIIIPYELNLLQNELGSYFNLTNKLDVSEESYLFRGAKLYGHRKIYTIKEMVNVVVYRLISKFKKNNE